MAKTVRGFITMKSYMFHDKDPIIDAYRTARVQSGLTFQEVRDGGGASVAAQRGWESGKTRRPQFATIAGCVKTLGKSIIDLTDPKNPRIR